MSTYHKFYFSSEDREDYANTGPSNCRIKLAKLIQPTCMELDFAQIPNTYYNINLTNNKFALNSAPITVPPGCYNLTDLLQTLATLLNAITPVINYNDVTNLITISAPSNFTLDFGVTNSIGQKLGFLLQQYTGTNTYTAIYGPKLYDSSIFINIAGIPAGCLTSNPNIPNTSFVVPNNVNKGEVIQFYAHSQFYLKPHVSTSDIQYLDIKILNDQGVQLTGLSNWVMLLKISN